MKRFFLFLLLAPLSLLAAMTAREIAQKVDSRDDGDRIITQMEMILIDKNEATRVRKMQTYAMDFGKDTHRVIFFVEPADVKNTAFLTYDYDDSARDDDQWLYLPALKKSKRIASSDKSGSFMGSDFSYSDMTSRNIEEYDYKILKEEMVGPDKVWIMEAVPKSKKTVEETGYSKSYMFVRQDNFVVIRAIHFVADSSKLKYFEVKKLEQIDGIWTTKEMEMKTVQGKQRLHSTIIRFHDVRYNQPIDEAFFSVRRIEKGL
jgi:hypothetical protein